MIAAAITVPKTNYEAVIHLGTGLARNGTMKTASLGKVRKKFGPVLASRSVQAAVMILRTGDASDEQVSNEHPRAEQWLYVVSGSGTLRSARRGKSMRSKKIKAGDLVLIEKGERHQVVNTGKQSLRTLNFYSPPAYLADGSVTKQAK